jgi:hypothetical protein
MIRCSNSESNVSNVVSHSRSRAYSSTAYNGDVESSTMVERPVLFRSFSSDDDFDVMDTLTRTQSEPVLFRVQRHDRVDDFDEGLRLERLSQVFRRARPLTAQFVEKAVFTREKHDRHVLGAFDFA